MWIACEQKGGAVQASLLSTANTGAAHQIRASANFSLNGQRIKNKHLEEETPKTVFNQKEKHSCHCLYFNNQMRESTDEFLIMMPIISCKYGLSIPDRNPIARVIEKSAYSHVWFSLRIKACLVWGFFSPSAWNSCCSSINFQSETNLFPFWHLKRLLCWSVKLTIFAAESMSRKTSEGTCVQLIMLPCQVTDPLNESAPQFGIWEAVQFPLWFDSEPKCCHCLHWAQFTAPWWSNGLKSGKPKNPSVCIGYMAGDAVKKKKIAYYTTWL